MLKKIKQNFSGILYHVQVLVALKNHIFLIWCPIEILLKKVVG
jgi:hypothetical protein